eukprot:TRINITY_DN3718_c0_g1_i1.p1 TRINITY_DN3718_c0_g1~~TRINITY_DN3718_c0_g1_i1.p1  ORF type:complete len:106 (-),score=15.30 TRINITY_DN3718_c0_g1_i1:43-360(-)
MDGSAAAAGAGGPVAYGKVLTQLLTRLCNLHYSVQLEKEQHANTVAEYEREIANLRFDLQEAEAQLLNIHEQLLPLGFCLQLNPATSHYDVVSIQHQNGFFLTNL